jgi:hypothetical protein
MRLKWILISVGLEIVLILMEDRCMVCAEHSIGSKSFWTHPMELLVEYSFGPFRDEVSIHAR